jgi:hypothetical protein
MLASRELASLDAAFAEWRQQLPPEWNNAGTMCVGGGVCDQACISFDGFVIGYNTVHHATVWLHFLALHLATVSMHRRLCQQHRSPTAPESATSTSRITDLTICISGLTNDICRTVPYFYQTPQSSSAQSLDPQRAVVLAWPLLLAIGTKSFLPSQELWLQSRLDDIATVTGATFLQAASESHDFWI